MASTFLLEIVTPDKNFFKEEVEMVIVRGMAGDIGIMANHTPVVTPLQIGRIRIKKANESNYMEAAVSSGYIQVTKEKATIVVDSAEWPHEIDIQRAEASKKRAEGIIGDVDVDEADVLRAEIALKKAINRLNVSGKIEK